MVQEHNDEGTLPLLTPGGRLREARLAAGLELEEVAARTRVSKRHLAAIEQDQYSELASRTYAIGFSKTYARTLGLDPESIAAGVRDELSRQEELHPRGQRSDHFEPGDPARVPPSTLAWIAGIGVVALFVLLFVFWRSFLDPAVDSPDLVKDEPSVAAKAASRPAGKAAAANAAASGPVRLMALEDGVWVQVKDAAGNQLFQKELSLNESYAVPADAQGAVLSTARPDALRVTVGTRTLDRMRPAPEIMRDVSLEPASLLTPPENSGLPTAAATSPAETSTDSEG